MTSRCHDNHFSGSKQNQAAIRTPLLIAVSYCSLNNLDMKDFLFQRMKKTMVYGLHCCARCKRLKLYVRFYGEIYV